MNLNSSELDQKFSDFLNGIFVETESLTLSELVDRLTTFVPDPHCCLLLLYKYAGRRIKCHDLSRNGTNELDINAREFVPESSPNSTRTLSPNLGEIDPAEIKEFVPTVVPPCPIIDILQFTESEGRIEPPDTQNWHELVDQQEEGIITMKKAISPKKLMKRIEKIVERENSYLTEPEICAIYDKSLKQDSNKFGASLLEDLAGNGFTCLPDFVAAHSIEVRIIRLSDFTNSREFEYFYSRPDLDFTHLDKIPYWELSQVEQAQIFDSFQSERAAFYAELRVFEGLNIKDLLQLNIQYRRLIHSHRLDTFDQIIDTFLAESPVSIADNVLCMKRAPTASLLNPSPPPGSPSPPPEEAEEEAVPSVFEPAKCFKMQSDCPPDVAQFARHAYDWEFYYLPNSCELNSQLKQITLKVILKTPEEVEEQRRQIQHHYTNKDILEASQLGKSLKTDFGKSPVVIVSGDHAFCRGEIRVFSSMKSIRVDLIDSELSERVKTFAHSELRLLDEKFSYASNRLEMVIDGLKWPEFEVEETTIFQIINTFFDRSNEPISTSGYIYSKGTGEMYISNIRSNKRPRESLEDNLRNFACFEECATKYDRSQISIEKSKSFSHKSDRGDMGGGYPSLLDDFRKHTEPENVQPSSMNFAEKIKENLVVPAENLAEGKEPTSPLEDEEEEETTSSPIEEISEQIPSEVAEYGDQINHKYQQNKMKTIWDDETGIIVGDSNTQMANNRLSQSQSIVNTLQRTEDTDLNDGNHPDTDQDGEPFRTESITSTSTKGSRKNRSALKMIRKINKKNSEKSK